MASLLDSRAHAAVLLRVLADTAADASVSSEELAALAERIGTHLRDEAAASPEASRPRAQLTLIEGGRSEPVTR